MQLAIAFPNQMTSCNGGKSSFYPSQPAMDADILVLDDIPQ